MGDVGTFVTLLDNEIMGALLPSDFIRQDLQDDHCVMGDVGTFVTLLNNIFQIFIVDKNFFSALSTTASIYPTDR